VVVTINAADFLRLAAASSLHAGLIVLRAQGLTRERQWEWLGPAVERLLGLHDDLVNKAVEITGPESSSSEGCRKTERGRALDVRAMVDAASAEREGLLDCNWPCVGWLDSESQWTIALGQGSIGRVLRADETS
jgi:hypothetical protein